VALLAHAAAVTAASREALPPPLIPDVVAAVAAPGYLQAGLLRKLEAAKDLER
jgi:hypothetical protein